MLDLLREESPELSDVNSERINFDMYCPIDGSVIYFQISESMARGSGLFKGKTKVEVRVPEVFFTKFIKFKTEITTRMQTVSPNKTTFFGLIVLKKEIKEERIECTNSRYTYSATEILTAWSNAGFPLEWGFKNEK